MEVDNQTALQHADIPIKVQRVPVPASQGRFTGHTCLVPQLNVPPPHSPTDSDNLSFKKKTSDILKFREKFFRLFLVL